MFSTVKRAPEVSCLCWYNSVVVVVATGLHWQLVTVALRKSSYMLPTKSLRFSPPQSRSRRWGIMGTSISKLKLFLIFVVIVSLTYILLIQPSSTPVVTNAGLNSLTFHKETFPFTYETKFTIIITTFNRQVPFLFYAAKCYCGKCS